MTNDRTYPLTTKEYSPMKTNIHLAAITALFALLAPTLHAQSTIPVLTIHDAEVQGAHFTFHHDVDCPPGWNVWLILENDQAAKIANPPLGTPGPIAMTRYQTLLKQKGRVRVPLEYLPTKREIKAKCKLFRMIPGWIGATKRIPRDGEYAVPTTAGL